MTDQSTLPVAPVATTTQSPMGLLMDPERFGHVQRVASMMANSALFPEHLRKGGEKQAVANAVLVFDMAFRMNEDPLTVAQNIYFVGGKPAWLTTYMVARANQSGVFSDQIEWTVAGKGDDLTVTAFATLAKSGRKAEVTVDMKMAKAEGWTTNKKYQSMPERMLRWRSATALIRLYAPEVMVGMASQIELETGEIRDVTPPSVKDVADFNPDPGPVIEDAEEAPIEEEKPEPKKAATKKAEKPKEEAKAEEAPPSDEDNPFTSVAERIMDDMLDGPVDGVLAMWEQELNQMEGAAPDLYKRVMDHAEQIQKSKGDG